jgi:hypothetical protein
MTDKIAEILGQLATALGVAVPYLWGALLKGATAAAIFAGISTVASAAFLIGGIKLMMWVKDRDGKENDFDEDCWFPLAMVVGAVTTFISTIAFFVNLNTLCLAALSPEYYVLSQILEKLGAK